MAPYRIDQDARRLLDRYADDSRPALDRLLTAAALQQHLTAAMKALADVAREEEGHSWADVGEVLSITRQAAHKRFAPDRTSDRTALDPQGAPMIGKTLPSGYLASLRDARDALLAEGGRERDLRLIDAALRRFGAGSGDDAAPVTRQELRDARDALRALPGREADVALIDAALADGDH